MTEEYVHTCEVLIHLAVLFWTDKINLRNRMHDVLNTTDIFIRAFLTFSLLLFNNLEDVWKMDTNLILDSYSCIHIL